MEIPFVTLKQYDGKVVAHGLATGASTGRLDNTNWQEWPDHPGWIKAATRAMFESRGEQLERVWRLDYPDINGLGNNIYRLDGATLQFCLKVLGPTEGNSREPLVWRTLGYGQEGDAAWIKGLPPHKFTYFDPDLSAVFTPYYPGVLKAISGGGYEFPLVLAVAAYLQQTLTSLHQQGLVYMDLCPSNILFKTTPKGAMLFFLTDMGGVKPLAGHDGDALQPLREIMVPRRWTRREVLPPADLFPQHDDPRLEPSPAYDFYTLARTCQILLGEGEPEDNEDYCLEDPMRPTRNERACFSELLQPWLAGTEQTAEDAGATHRGLTELFGQFFLERATFCAAYLDLPAVRQRWQQTLNNRLQRYRMALTGEAFEALDQEMNAQLTNATGTGLQQEQAQLEALAAALKEHQLDQSAELLHRLANESRLARVSEVAAYALQHHKKLARGIFGGRIRAQLENLDIPEKHPAQSPELATARALRRDNNTELGILRRVI